MKSLIKFLPVIIFAILVIVVGYDILISGMIATFLTVLIAMIFTKKGFSEIFEIGVENTKNSTVIFFVIMFAYAVAEVFLATGVGASMINIALSFGITAKTVALVGFLVTSALSIATGTSWGTFAACAPVFLWLNYIVGGNLLLTLGSIAGGCCFGDNLGLISDTTVLSSGFQGVKVVDRVRHQGVWSLGCFLLSAIIIFLMSLGLPGESRNAMEAINSISPEAWAALEEQRPVAVTLLEQVKEGVPYYMALPVVIVVAMAFKGIHTMACLGSGILSALILGSIAGTIPDLDTFFNTYIFDGMAGAGSWAIILIMWITAFAGIMKYMKAFDPIYSLILRISKKVRHLMTCNALLCIFVNVVFADELSEIATTGPILREMVEENIEGSEKDIYTLKLRSATYADALGVFGSQFIPWHAFIVFFLSIANSVYPLHEFVPFDFVRYNFLAIIAVVSLIVLTFTGLDRFIPLMKIPSEPDVRLKRK